MRDFIKKSLTDALLKGVKGIKEFYYQYNRTDGDTISIKGIITKKISNIYPTSGLSAQKQTGTSAVPYPYLVCR